MSRTRTATAAIRIEPEARAMQVSQLLYGERFVVEDETGDWVYGKSAHDGYGGFVLKEQLVENPLPTSHYICARESFLFANADIKEPPLAALSFASEIMVQDKIGAFVKTPDGYVFSAHVVPRNKPQRDLVKNARLFLGAPYLWGGRAASGLDCSGLIQVILKAAHIDAPRDSSEQEQALGKSVADADDIEIGDLLFWAGHVALVSSKTHIIHANAHAMCVCEEARAGAIARLEAATNSVTHVKRLKI